MEKQLLEKFQELYGEGGDIRSYFSPGRVNLIGEHTDYNGGHCFSMCIDNRNLWSSKKKRG